MAGQTQNLGGLVLICPTALIVKYAGLVPDAACLHGNHRLFGELVYVRVLRSFHNFYKEAAHGEEHAGLDEGDEGIEKLKAKETKLCTPGPATSIKKLSNQQAC
eukprot:1158648-Pelagomonas_calceolata.AAC.4